MADTRKSLSRVLEAFDRVRISSVLVWLGAAGIVWVGLIIFIPYQNYIPPWFERGFLYGREDYFFGLYGVAFYAHIATAPMALFVGLVQLSHRFRSRWPIFHRRAGKFYVAIVLLIVAPSGLMMATRAPFGRMAISGFVVLSIATWVVTLIAWREAKVGRFRRHGEWMWRSFLLIASAVLLRLISVIASDLRVAPEIAYPVAAWGSWVPSLVVYEWVRLKVRSERKFGEVKRTFYDPGQV